LNKPGTTESFPFDEHVLVFKVHDKIFALTHIEEFSSINLKCDPQRAIELREKYEGIEPGYHMNKKHWNTISMDGSISEQIILDLIDHSYDLVFGSLPAKIRLHLKK
jgi:predicted DNA-binding protein (MmcQ/YjbR family)